MFMLNYATFCGCMQQLKQNNQSLLILKKYSKNMCQEANFSNKYANKFKTRTFSYNRYKINFKVRNLINTIKCILKLWIYLKANLV